MIEAKINLINEDCKRSCTETSFFSSLHNQTILVTGGTGFIGKWIAEMVSFVNESQNFNIKLYLLSRDVQQFEVEVPHLANKEFIKLIQQDVRNIHDLPADVNYIIHAAGSPDNREHVSQPLRTLDTFCKGTNAVLDAAARLPQLKKIVHISSHQIYGQNDSESSISESFNGKLESNSITFTYAESKRVGETICAIYRSQLKLPITIMRPFAFIGPYHDLEKPWALNNFIRDGILGGPIRILGNGLTVRSYLYASDMAFWILKALADGKSGETYNLGSSEAISLEDLANKISDSIGGGIEILSRSSKENYNHISQLVPNTSKIVKALDVKETYNLDTAIKRTIVWNQLNKVNK